MTAKLWVCTGPDEVTVTDPPPAMVCSWDWLRLTVWVCPSLEDVVYVTPLAGGLDRSLSGTHSVWM